MNIKNLKSLFNMNNQSKTIIIFWLFSSLLIFFTALIVIGKTEQKIEESYRNFAIILTKTFASESIDVAQNFSGKYKENKLKQYTQRLLDENQEIEFVEYKDNNSAIYFSVKSNENEPQKHSFEINAPIYSDNQNAGSVTVGFTANSMNSVSKTARNSIILIFSIMWLLSLVAVLINTLVITRQISLLSYGVKKISSGEFGYKLHQNELWGEIKLLFDEFNSMSAKLRRYDEKNIDEITYEKNKLESVLMSIANGVIVCDNNDKVMLVNNAGAEMLYVDKKEFHKTDLNDYVDMNANIPFKEHIENFKKTPLIQRKKHPLVYQLQISDKIYKVLMSPIFTLTQDYLGYIVVLHDITKEAETDKLKSNFISNVSHELRTPVTVLRSYIDTLCNYGQDFQEAEKQEFLQIMDQEAKRLNDMVNNILDFSRLDASNIKVEKGFMDIKPIIESTVNSISILAQDKNITINVSVEENLPEVYINRDSIEGVMKNLLSNAVKYSNNDGSIEVKAYKNENFVECYIKDCGIGIAKEHLHKIFDRFYRVENKTHTVKGTGLGLHLVKVAIEKHHSGKVFVESELNKGSKFGFCLPILNSKEIENNVVREI